MAGTNRDNNSYDRPTSTVMREVQALNREMSDLCILFGTICDRMEACARKVRDCSRKADRQLFKAFFDSGIAPGASFRILGSKDENAIYTVTGMDGGGIYYAGVNGGPEYYFDIYENQDYARRLRTVSQRRAQRG